MSTDNVIALVCPRCNGSDVNRADVRSAFFHRDRLVVVENIPALVCNACNEQFYDDQTVVMLDLLRGDDFPAKRASGEIRVPVFSLRERLESAT